MVYNNESILFEYFNSIFIDEKEKSLFLTAFNEDYNRCYNNDETHAWVNVSNEFKELLKYNNVNDYRVSVDKNATNLIRMLFEKHVNENTFVVLCSEYEDVLSFVSNTKNYFALPYKEIDKFNINSIIKKYNESLCTNIFVYGAGMTDNLVYNAFYIKLKEYLIENNIEHTIVLDDIKGMFLVPRDYSIFDYVIGTCMFLLPNFKSGILLSKNSSECIGYQDLDCLCSFLNIIKQVIINKKDKLYLFKFMIEQYLIEELRYKNFYEIANTPPLFVIVNINDDNCLSLIKKHKDELLKCHVEVCGNVLTIMYADMIQENSETIVNNLKKLKNIMQKSVKLDKLSN